MRTAIDSNIVIDLLAGSPERVGVAERALLLAGSQGSLVLPIICYAEIAGRFTRRRDLYDFLDTASLTLLPLEQEAAFLAGTFFREYRQRGGDRNRILADFLIAAQAQTQADRLLTNDSRFYGTSFPELTAVSPTDLD